MLVVVLCGGAVALTPLVARWLGLRAYGRRLLAHTVEIYDYLTGSEGELRLGAVAPRSSGQRWCAGRLIATLSHNFVECRAERVRALATLWGVEQMLLQTILRGHPRRATKALELLLRLHPSLPTVVQVEGRRFGSFGAAFARLLVLIYGSPSQVATLLKMHPHRLCWQEVGRVVEVLRMRHPILEPLRWEGVAGYNVELLELYMAQVEGVGDVREVAERLSEAPERTLRRAATNTLWSVRLFGVGEALRRGPRG
jgi:hypothetical protein